MNANCRAGDIAVITRNPTGRNDVAGSIVEVISVAPKEKFLLPNGDLNSAVQTDSLRWVCRFRNKVEVMNTIRGAILVEYATVFDKYLRPIRPSEGEDETLTWAGKPEKVTA